MVSLLVVGFIANLLITPVAPKYHEPGKDTKDTAGDQDPAENAGANATLEEGTR